MADIVGMVWNHLTAEIQALKEKIYEVKILTERSETSGGVESSLLADAPLSPLSTTGDLLFITNGRKPTEGAGLGTGVLAYYNTSTNSWFRTADDTAVVI